MAPKSSGSLQSVIWHNRVYWYFRRLYTRTRHIEGWIQGGASVELSVSGANTTQVECSLLAQTSPLRRDAESESGFGCRF
jgi:hypothetical protein